MVKLKGKEPLGMGNCRLVFEHPDFSDLLIKVIRPDKIDDRFGKGASLWRFKRNRRFGQYISFSRETQEFLVSRAESIRPPSFVQSIVGFTETDFGLGMIVKAIRNANGELAPTLLDLIKGNAFDPAAEAALERFFNDMLQSRMVFSDLNLGSLVYQSDREEFVMIDGLGITNPIPIKALSRWANRRSKEKRFAKFRARIATLREQS